MPWCSAVRTTARTAAFIPQASPPLVSTARLVGGADCRVVDMRGTPGEARDEVLGSGNEVWRAEPSDGAAAAGPLQARYSLGAWLRPVLPDRARRRGARRPVDAADRPGDAARRLPVQRAGTLPARHLALGARPAAA